MLSMPTLHHIDISQEISTLCIYLKQPIRRYSYRDIFLLILSIHILKTSHTLQLSLQRRTLFFRRFLNIYKKIFKNLYEKEYIFLYMLSSGNNEHIRFIQFDAVVQKLSCIIFIQITFKITIVLCFYVQKINQIVVAHTNTNGIINVAPIYSALPQITSPPARPN